MKAEIKLMGTTLEIKLSGVDAEPGRAANIEMALLRAYGHHIANRQPDPSVLTLWRPRSDDSTLETAREVLAGFCL